MKRALIRASHACRSLHPCVAAHPQYLGSSLCISAVGVLLHDASRPGNTLLAVWWVALYVATGLLEEGACHSSEPFAPLAKGADPFTDTHTRPVVRHRAVVAAWRALTRCERR